MFRSSHAGCHCCSSSSCSGRDGVMYGLQACRVASRDLHCLAHDIVGATAAAARHVTVRCMACRHGGRGEQGTRWWTQACGSCGARAGCTTASASSAPASWSRTCCCPGSGASSTTGTPCWTLTWSAPPSAGSMSPAALQVCNTPLACAGVLSPSAAAALPATYPEVELCVAQRTTLTELSLSMPFQGLSTKGRPTLFIL